MTTQVMTVDELRARPTCSVEQAAHVLGVSRGYAYRLVKDGGLPAIRLGDRGRVRVPTSALLRMIGEDA